MDQSIEKQLVNSGQLMVSTASAMTITNQSEYEAAATLLVEIKTRMKPVKDYWKKPKADAQSAHKTLCEREKDMLTPLADAEAIIKKSMVAYDAAVQKAKREAEAAEARRKREEVERMLQKAVEAEKSGNDMEAAVNVAMAEMISDMPAQAAVEEPKATGVNLRKTWKARVIDPKKVPAYFNGVEIRTVNQTALNNIAKLSDGMVKIPGVEFYQETMVFSSSRKTS